MTRIAIVRNEKCNPVKCNSLCPKVCPVNRRGDECIQIPENKAKIDEQLCIGCNICSNRCPFDAISIINLPEELNKQPVHRYGRNGFHLYNLPIPIFGKVIGIVGRNGIGKSTAIKILAGVISPNMGRENDAGIDELIKAFKGTEAQIFFEKIRDRTIKTAYKPQAVDLIPKHASGTVLELLKKADERNLFDSIVDEFELQQILDHNIGDISGGELQRVAIAATVLKDANLYVFDEPTSYLDIKQRIKIAKYIKAMAKEKTAVLVVEHDLIILDYMTDLVNLMYGKEGCYGIVSLPKTSRAGINVYLEGYLKEENIRFRDSPIKFMAKPPIETKREHLLTGWKGIEKKCSSFRLLAKEGQVYKHQVTGILGENGIGKTTLVKILAGVVSADKGEVLEKVQVSYKPQYINSESDELVLVMLQNAIQKYSALIINPLDIKPLFDKKISELSGGELQRVSIAYALGQDAMLYLLDEPSAHLDVEQRLIVSKVIRDVMEQRGSAALIVDHDLLFIDYLSERLIVFEGKPAIHGTAKGPFSMADGMNIFLTGLGITLRRDIESLRPRINKEDSRKDREQKDTGKLYYG